MEKRRPQLSADELQQVKWLLGGVLTLLAVSTVFYMDVDAWAFMALTALAAVASLAWPTLPARVPRVVHTLAFPAIVAVFVTDLWLWTEVLPALVRLDMMLLLYRNLSYRRRRDDLQVVVLGLFLIVVAGVLTVSLVFAAQILVYTACALAFLFAITLSDGAKAPPPEGEGAPPWAERADWGALFRRLREANDWRVLGLGAVLFAGVVGVSALLFLAIPRFQLENSMFLDRFISKKARSGFSDTIRFGEVTEIQQDNSVALSIDVTDPAQIPPAPYWRMLVLDDYRDGTFRLSPWLRIQAFGPERTGAQVVGEARPRRGEAVRWTFYLESGVSRYLPLAGRFGTLRFQESQNYRHAGALNVLALRQEPVTMTAYQVENFELGAALPDPEFARAWRERLETGKGRNTFQARTVFADEERGQLQRVLTEAVGAEKLAPAEFVRRARDWLRAQHGYTLAPRIPGREGDPLLRWMTSREAGHCELFAGAMVLLARSAGLPARVVTGFRGGSWNAYSKNFTVRNSDAHAWAEVFDLENGVWLRADPLEEPGVATAEGAGAAAAARRVDEGWSARLDSLRVFWYRRIVSFDRQSQAETLRAVKEATQNSGRELREAVERALAALRAWATAPWDTRRWLQISALLLGATLAGWGWRRIGRAWWRDAMSRRGGRREDPIRREAGRLLRQFGERSEAGGDIVPDLQRLRYGAQATWREPEQVFRRARRELRSARSAPTIGR